MGVTECLILLSMTLGSACFENSKRCTKPTDIIFLLDGSRNVFYDDWIKQKSFVENIIETLDIRPDGIRVGLVAFGHMVHKGAIINLQPFVAKPNWKTLLKSIHQLLGVTNTGLGIEKVQEIFKSQGRPEATFIAVVLTGKSDNQTYTIEQAQSAKTKGIVITAAGIGQKINTSELKAIATVERFLFNVSDATSLSRILEDLTQRTCAGRKNFFPECKPIFHFANGITDRQHEKGAKVAVTNINFNSVVTGESRLELQSHTGADFGEQLSINMTFKMPSLLTRRNPFFGRLQPLVSNCESWMNRKRPSIWILVGPSTVEMALKTEKEDKNVSFNMSVKSGVNKMTLTYDGSHVVARVNGVEETQPLAGDIMKRETGISLGLCTRFPSFVGQINEVEISRCGAGAGAGA